MQVFQHARRCERQDVVRRRSVFLHGVGPTRERIAMIRFASVASPVTEELTFGHIERMIAGNVASQAVKLKLTEACLGAFFINRP